MLNKCLCLNADKGVHPRPKNYTRYSYRIKETHIGDFIYGSKRARFYRLKAIIEYYFDGKLINIKKLYIKYPCGWWFLMTDILGNTEEKIKDDIKTHVDWFICNLEEDRGVVDISVN